MRSDLIAFATPRSAAVFKAIGALAIAAVMSSALSVMPAAAQVEGPHAKAFADSEYPTAATCGACHTQIYQEWSSSSHAYASISPMFHKFEQIINDLSQGTVGSFCVRCHQQVGTQRGELRETPLWERSQISREGITCITCHRVSAEYGKVNGDRRRTPAC